MAEKITNVHNIDPCCQHIPVSVDKRMATKNFHGLYDISDRIRIQKIELGPFVFSDVIDLATIESDQQIKLKTQTPFKIDLFNTLP